MKRKKKIIKVNKRLDMNLFYLSNVLDVLSTVYVYHDDYIKIHLIDLLDYVNYKLYGAVPENSDLIDEKISILSIYESECD